MLTSCTYMYLPPPPPPPTHTHTVYTQSQLNETMYLWLPPLHMHTQLQVRPDCPTPPERHGDSVARKLFDHHETVPHTTPTRPPPPHSTHYNTAHAITRPERDDLPTRLDKERTNQTREQTRLERALAEAQRVLLEREKEVSELRAHRMREGVDGGWWEGG